MPSPGVRPQKRINSCTETCLCVLIPIQCHREPHASPLPNHPVPSRVNHSSAPTSLHTSPIRHKNSNRHSSPQPQHSFVLSSVSSSSLLLLHRAEARLHKLSSDCKARPVHESTRAPTMSVGPGLQMKSDGQAFELRRDQSLLH